MCILLLFNDRDTVTFAEMERATGVQRTELQRSLMAFCVDQKKKQASRLLLRQGTGSEIADTDEFSLNPSFASDRVKVAFTPALSKETVEEKQETNTRLNEQRQYEIDAAIVRIMKSRKHVRHVDLLSDVTSQLQARFLPLPSVVKKRIESLIEREYMQRTEGKQ